MMKIEIIEWIDSYGCSASWQEIADGIELETITCFSIGYVLKENDNLLVIVPHYAPKTVLNSPQGCGDMCIPKKCIVSRRELN